MNHTVMKEKVFALYDGELVGDARREVETHLQGCPECRALYARWTAAAKVVFKEQPNPETSEFLVRQVMDRIETWERPRPVLRRQGYLRWLVPVLGVTAMLFAVIRPPQQPVSVEALLLEDTSSPASWVLSNTTPTADEIFSFTMEG